MHEALNPVFMQVSVLLYVLGHGAFAQPSCPFLIIFLISMQMSSSLFVLFWVLFLLKPCKMRDFGCLKDKNREKDNGKGRGECGGSRIFLRE